MATIAANLIVQNEAHRLPRCLAALDWVDEVIVVDGGSTDGTADVARRFGARVLLHPFVNFAKQRNVALAATRAAWVLSIDADELVSPALRREIAGIVRADTTRYDAYVVPIHSWIFGRRFRWSGTQNECKLRLFRRRPGVRWHGAVHERLRVRGRVGHLHAPIQHESTADVEHWLSKVARYLPLANSCPRHPTAAALAMFARRFLVYKGFLDGPEGLAFALLSAWEEWMRCSPAPMERYHERFGLLLRCARRLAGSGRRRGAAARMCTARTSSRSLGRAA